MADVVVPTGNGGADPDRVQDLAELKDALTQLRGSRSYRQLDRAAEAHGGLAAATLNNLLGGPTVPTEITVKTFLTACGLSDQAQIPWLAARQRVASPTKPAGAMAVRSAQARLLGVHAAIRVDGSGGLPPYVARDLDTELREAVKAAAAGGGFVLLVGRSSVGKTRSLFEAVRDQLAGWWLLHPMEASSLYAIAEQPAPRTVVWLDELQDYLDGVGGLPASVARRLITSGRVLVATMWPDEYGTRIIPPYPGRPDRYANDRKLLKLAHVIHVPEDFSAAERKRAAELSDDARIRIALEASDAGFTQIMAAGPALIDRWENAPDKHCYGEAVITAAIDARRVGTRALLTLAFLEAAAPAYLTSAQQASAPNDWLDSAVRYATEQLHGATSALMPVAAGMGRVAGYTVADYLHQHGRRVRRNLHLPDEVWQAIVDHHHPSDARLLAANAERRNQGRHAINLYRRAADGGDTHASSALAVLLADQGHVGELRQRAGSDTYAADQLARLLIEQGDPASIAEVVQRARAGDEAAAERLARRLDEQNRAAADRRADRLARRGKVEALRRLANGGDVASAVHLLDMLVQRGEIDELRQQADAGNQAAAVRLAALLVEQGEIDELRRRADAGDVWADSQLSGLLLDCGEFDKLHLRAEAGSEWARILEADSLAHRGKTNELRQRADAGDEYAQVALSIFLERNGLVDELQQEIAAGTHGAVNALRRLSRKDTGSPSPT